MAVKVYRADDGRWHWCRTFGGISLVLERSEGFHSKDMAIEDAICEHPEARIVVEEPVSGRRL